MGQDGCHFGQLSVIIRARNDAVRSAPENESCESHRLSVAHLWRPYISLWFSVSLSNACPTILANEKGRLSRRRLL